MKMVEVRKTIRAALLAIHPRVYFQVADENADFPYVVYDLPNSIDDGSMERFILDVDGWDNSADTSALETLMDRLDEVLHRNTVMVGTMSLTVYRENRLTLTDDDKRIRRRKYIYQVRTHQAGG